jgi:hypothetical protein
MNKRLQLSSGILGLLAASWSALASPTGLNKIPTADTTGHRTLVFQEYTTFGAHRPPEHTAGFKMGLQPWGQKFEWGLDGHLAPGDAGPAAFQVKYAVEPWEKLPTLGLGSANLAVTSEDRDRSGQPFSYAVLSHDFHFLRLHAGYGVQHRGNSALLGADRTFKLFDQDLMLRADAIQTANQHNWVASFGGLYPLGKYFALESWVSQPIHRAPPSVTVKLNFVIKF